MQYDFWAHFLPIVIYILLICFLVIGIILGIKTIIAVDKIDKIATSVGKKVDSLNSLFGIIDFTTDKIASITDRFVEFVTGIFGKILLKFKKDKEEQ